MTRRKRDRDRDDRVCRVWPCACYMSIRPVSQSVPLRAPSQSLFSHVVSRPHPSPNMQHQIVGGGATPPGAIARQRGGPLEGQRAAQPHPRPERHRVPRRGTPGPPAGKDRAILGQRRGYRRQRRRRRWGRRKRGRWRRGGGSGGRDGRGAAAAEGSCRGGGCHLGGVEGVCVGVFLVRIDRANRFTNESMKHIKRFVRVCLC